MQILSATQRKHFKCIIKDEKDHRSDENYLPCRGADADSVGEHCPWHGEAEDGERYHEVTHVAICKNGRSRG